MRIAFEGLPGAGKTSALANYVQHNDHHTLLFPEVNLDHIFPSSNQFCYEHYNNYWIKRIEIIKRYNIFNRILLFDRSYYTTLAYLFATMKEQGYLSIKQKFKQYFVNNFFDMIVLFFVKNSIGICRRIYNQGSIDYPWNQKYFLNKIQEFYKHELSTVFNGEIIYIDTTNMNFQDMNSQIVRIVQNFPKSDNNRQYFLNSNYVLNKILFFAKQYNLGKNYTELVNFLGVPTVYFRQYAVHLLDKEPIFSDNKTLEKILIISKDICVDT